MERRCSCTQFASRIEDAEDAVQEAFLRYWRSGRKSQQPIAYLFSCVRTAAVDRMRGHTRSSRREKEVAGRSPQASWFACELEAEEQRQRIEAALSQLPLEQKEVLVLKIWGELTLAQVAVVQGVSPNTAASRYRYGLDAMRALLPKETFDER